MINFNTNLDYYKKTIIHTYLPWIKITKLIFAKNLHGKYFGHSEYFLEKVHEKLNYFVQKVFNM